MKVLCEIDNIFELDDSSIVERLKKIYSIIRWSVKHRQK